MVRPFVGIGLIAGFATWIAASVCSAETIVTQFHAEINGANVISQGIAGTGATATGVGDFVLTQVMGNPDATTLSYVIQLNGVDLDSQQTPDILDNLAAAHLHDVTECNPEFPQCQPGDTALTQHVLNIDGAPRRDDDDLVIDPVAGTYTGLWDVTDTDLTFPATESIADPAVLSLLFGGQIHFLLHTNGFPSGAIGGQLAIVPEPTAWITVTLGLLAIAMRTRHCVP